MKPAGEALMQRLTCRRSFICAARAVSKSSWSSNWSTRADKTDRWQSMDLATLAASRRRCSDPWTTLLGNIVPQGEASHAKLYQAIKDETRTHARTWRGTCRGS